MKNKESHTDLDVHVDVAVAVAVAVIQLAFALSFVVNNILRVESLQSVNNLVQHS